MEGRPNGSDVARDIRANADYFKKIRFSVPGDLYPHATVAPFLDDTGKPTYNGDNSHRPNPQWFQQRVDVAVRTAAERDLITDLIMSGVDREDSRSALPPRRTTGTQYPTCVTSSPATAPSPTCGSACRTNTTSAAQDTPPSKRANLADKAKALLVYPNPLSIHANSGSLAAGTQFLACLERPLIVQKKMKTIPAAVDFLLEDHAGAQRRPAADRRRTRV